MPVIVNGQRIGAVEIVAEPHDEIAEVWDNTVALGAVALIVNVAVIVLLYFLFGRVLDPLTGVGRGLADLEQRNYRVRLPRPPAQELAAITERFNALAEALDAARAENLRLNERLITAQDDERRRTAMELHDEVGPSLFGLKANAGSIETAVGALPEETRRSVQARVARHTGDHRASADHQPQPVESAAADGARPCAAAGSPVGAGARAGPPEPADRVLVLGRQAHAQLRRLDRPHHLPLRPGEPDQRHPPCATRACRHRARRGGRGAARARTVRSSSPSATMGAGSIPPRRWASACAACRNACKDWAAAIRSKARAAAAPACAS